MPEPESHLQAVAGIDDTTYQTYLRALISGDRVRCREVATSLTRNGVGVRTLYADLFQRSLYEVGELWQCRRISVAIEHVATAITEGLLAEVRPGLFAREHCGKSAVVACVTNEYHQIGGEMVADTFEMHGWHGHFLGAGNSQEQLLQMVAEKKPHVVALSLSILANFPVLLQTLKAVRSQHPALPVLVGGQAFRWGGHEALKPYDGVLHLPSLDALESWIETE